jgi:hypothetical protein
VNNWLANNSEPHGAAIDVPIQLLRAPRDKHRALGEPALVLHEFGESFLDRGISLTDASSASAAAAEPSDEAE